MDAAPVEIIVQKTERHDIKAEAIEHVARQLAVRDGIWPDADMRCSQIVSGYSTCTLEMYPKPAWRAYAAEAERILKGVFK